MGRSDKRDSVLFYRRHGKRAFDLFLGGAGLLFLFPVLALLAVLVWKDVGLPVFYRQYRPGRQGKPFRILKFRTMKELSDTAGNPLPDAERLTPMGRFLRRYSLDELPELLNVLRGEMSLVGPRPLLVEYLERYTTEQARRHEVKPGITGWAQVNGRNDISWEEKFDLDIWYVDHWSFQLDIKILLLTLIKVIKREGITQKGRSTVDYFKGSQDPKL